MSQELLSTLAWIILFSVQAAWSGYQLGFNLQSGLRTIRFERRDGAWHLKVWPLLTAVAFLTLGGVVFYVSGLAFTQTHVGVVRVVETVLFLLLRLVGWRVSYYTRSAAERKRIRGY